VLACGTSWHAGLVGKFLIEELAHLPVEVDYGSEFRYRNPVDRTSGRSPWSSPSLARPADTLAALREARRKGARSVAVCNVVGSMATREAEGTIYTHAARDRRGLDQGVHLAARRAPPARAQPGAGPQDALRAGGEAHVEVCCGCRRSSNGR